MSQSSKRWSWLDFVFSGMIVAGAAFLIWAWCGRSDAPISPAAPIAQIAAGAAVGALDADEVEAFLEWHGIPAPQPPLMELEAGLARRVEEVLADLSAEQTAARFGAVGQVFEFLRRPEAARACYRRAADEDATDHRWPHYLGRLALADGDVDAGEKHFQRAIELRPSFAASHAQLARVHFEAERWSDAISAIDRAIEHDGANPFGHVLLARIAMRQGRYEDAIRHGLDALEREADHGQAHAILGQAYARAGDHDRAALHAARASGARPEMADVGDPLVGELLEASESTKWLSILAASQHAQGDWPALINTLEELALREPEQIAHQLDLADAYTFERRLDDADALLVDVLEASPRSSRAYQLLSVVDMFRKEFDRALARADAAIALDGDFALAHKARAAALHGLGRLDEAVQSAKTAAALRPQDEQIRRLVEVLKSLQVNRPSGGP